MSRADQSHVFDIEPNLQSTDYSRRGDLVSQLFSATCLIWSTTSAGPGWVEVAGGLLSFRLSTASGCDSHLACARRPPRQGVAPEGYARLKV